MGRSRTRILTAGCAVAAALVSTGICGCGTIGANGGHSASAVDAGSGGKKKAAPGTAPASPTPPPPPTPHATNLPWQILVAKGSNTVVDGATIDVGECAAGAVTWISAQHARFELHPGGTEPGGSGWAEPDYLPEGGRVGLAATFNGGFRMGDSGGGFYLDGQQSGTLTTGAASEFFSSTGGLNVGSYGRDGSAGGKTIGVRQNLGMLVDDGTPTAATTELSPWGASWGGATCVRRSGVGVDAAGNTVYATGSDLSPHGLAELLVAAGAVRAMQLDINPNWPSFMYYDQAGAPHMYGDSDQSPDRYLTPTDRDFVAVYAK
jgi:Phosphodiester glycosidase